MNLFYLIAGCCLIVQIMTLFITDLADLGIQTFIWNLSLIGLIFGLINLSEKTDVLTTKKVGENGR